MRKSLVPGIRTDVAREDVLRMYAVARLMLHPWIRNIQATWVKQGPQLTQECLQAGTNDFGGILMNESISTSAGTPHGQFLNPAELRIGFALPVASRYSARQFIRLCECLSKNQAIRNRIGTVIVSAPTRR